MGFFDSSQTTESSQTYDNPELRDYTATYRQNAPFAFQTLDPSATLAAKRSKAKTKLQKTYWDAEGKYIGPKARLKELQQLADEEAMERDAANAGLDRIQKRQESGEFLTPKETEFINTQLDKAFESSRKTGYEDWSKATQMMAGSRGLRMSDTPAAEPALRELRNFEIGLGSKRAEMELNATLQFSKNQQDFDANFSSMLKQLGQNRWATRQGFLFGGGMSGATQLGFTQRGTQTSSGSMSGFGKVMGSLAMAGGVLDLGKKIGGMFMAGGAGGGMSGLMSGAGGGGMGGGSVPYTGMS